MKSQELYDITDLEKVLGLSRKKVYGLRDKGYLQMTPLGGKWVITRNKLDKFLEKIDSGEIYINEELM